MSDLLTVAEVAKSLRVDDTTVRRWIKQGGTGKTSVVINLAAAVTMAGHDVLILDGDRQRNTTWTLLGDDATPTLADVMTGRCQLAEAIKESRENLYVVPSDKDLEKVGTYLKDHRKAYNTVAKQLETLDPQPYLVLIDHPGAYSTVMEALLLASQEMSRQQLRSSKGW